MKCCLLELESLSNTLTNLTEFDVVVVFYFFLLFISIFEWGINKRKEKEKIYFLKIENFLFIYKAIFFKWKIRFCFVFSVIFISSSRRRIKEFNNFILTTTIWRVRQNIRAAKNTTHKIETQSLYLNLKLDIRKWVKRERENIRILVIKLFVIYFRLETK